MKPKPGNIVCRFHPKCNKESCTFTHPQHPIRKKPSSPKDMDEKPCPHFLHGKCAYGAACRRSHEADTNTGANVTNAQSNKRSGAKKARNSSPMVSEDEDNADVLAGNKEPCSLYLMGQCTVEECEFDHPGEKLTTQAAPRPSSSSKPEKSPTPPTYPGSNWADDDEQSEEGETKVHSRNDDHPPSRTRSSASKSAVIHEPPSPTVLQAPLTMARAPTLQVTEPTQFLQQIMTPESQHYPHISQVMLHWSQFADPLARADLAFCKLLAQDKCINAESCTFRHSLTVGEYFSLFRDPQPTLITLRREGDPITEATMTTIQPVIPTAIHPASLLRVSTPSVSPNVGSGQKYFSKECFFFPSGKCTNGDRCPYAHVQPQDPPPAEIAPESNDDDDWSPVFTQNPKVNKPCKFFGSTYGYCRDGPDCHYLHQAEGTLEANRGSIDDNGLGQDWGMNDRSTNTTDAHNQDEREDDQGIDEWNGPQDISSWCGPTPEEPLENRSGQSSGTFSRLQSKRPCYRFKEGTCRWGASCKFAHDNEPGNGMGYRNATRNLQATNNDWSEDALGTSARPAMTPDFAETDEFEHWEKRNVEEEPGDPQKTNDSSSFLSPQTGDNDDGDGDGWNATWAPAQEPINSPWVKSKKYCLAYGQGHCGKGDTCQFRHADPSALSSQQASPPSFPTDAPENESFSSIDTVPASNIPHEAEKLPLVSNIPDHPKIEKLIMNATVSFGPAFAPVSIEPLAESRELRLSNLPSDVTVEDVQALLQPCDGVVLENTLRTFQHTASVRVDFANAEQAMKGFEYLHLQKDSSGGRKLIASFANVKLRHPAEKNTLKVSWPKPTLLGWSHYPTIGKAKEEAARLNGVIVKGRKIQVEFCSPDRRQKDNFAIKFSNLSPETTKDEIGQLCQGHTLTTGFDIPTYLGTSLETIKEEFHPFGELAFERIPDSESDESPNSFAFVMFPCESAAQEVMTKLSSRELSCIGHQSLEIKPVYFARYRVSRRIFDVVRQEIERIKEDGSNYTIHCDEIFENYHIRLIASTTKYEGFSKANAELCALLQGETARTDDGNIVWDDYFEMPTKNLQHFLTQEIFIIPDERTRRIRLFGSKAERKKAMEPLLKLLSKVHSRRHEVIVPRGSVHSLIEQFESIQKDMGVNKVAFDVLSSKIIVRGTNEERSNIQNRVDSLNSPTQHNPGCCEICHHQPDDPRILVCLHVYCTPCLRLALRSASHGPLRCIGATNSASNDGPGQCLGHIPYIDGILPHLERDRLLASSFLAHVRDSEDLFVCPSIDCKAVYRTGRQGLNLHCSRCGTEICSFCQTLAHIGLSCSDMKLEA